MSDWQFFWCSLAAPDFSVAGVPFQENIFKRFRDTKQSADVFDPMYGEPYKYRIYALDDETRAYEIAYSAHPPGAHTPGTPGAYFAFARPDTLPFCTPRFKWDPEKFWFRLDTSTKA